MSCRAHHILSALLLTCVLDACVADPQTNSSAGAASVSNRVERTSSVEQAFRRALGSLKGRVNLLDRDTRYRVSRAEDDSWHIQLKAARDVPGGNLLIIVKDSGIVDLTLSQTNADSAAWLSSAKAGGPDPEVKVRPEAAFRWGLQALEKWYKMSPDSFLAVRGRITLSRTAKDEWFMDVSGYPSTPLGGRWVEIKDNGKVNITSGL